MSRSAGSASGEAGLDQQDQGQRRSSRRRLGVAHHDVEDGGIGISNRAEILQVVPYCARSKLEARQIQQSLRQLQFRILPLSEAIGAAAVALIEQHALAHGIQLADALIAATALDSGLRFCTGNAKHFHPIRGLSCVVFRPQRGRSS